MGFLKKREVILTDVHRISFTDSSYLVSSNGDSIVLSDSRYDFFLLELILDNWRLFLIGPFELFPEKGVSGSDDDSLRVVLGYGAGDELSDMHHGSISHPRVSLLGEFSFGGD